MRHDEHPTFTPAWYAPNNVEDKVGIAPLPADAAREGDGAHAPPPPPAPRGRILPVNGAIVSLSFDEALAHPGPLLAAWDLTAWKGERTLALFSLTEDRAVALSHRGAAPGREAAAEAPLRARGIPVGACDSGCDFVWLEGAEGVTVWGPHGRVLMARGDALTLAGGRTIPRAELERIRTYAADGSVERGVRARLRSGGEVHLVRDVSASAAADPTYGRNELLYETEWAGAIASAVARWAGVAWDDGI